MKVALVCERFDARGGGLEQWVVQLARRLTLRGHHIEVMTFRAGDLPEERVTVHVLPWTASRLERADVAERALGQIAVDVVHDVGVGCRCDILHPQGGSRLANAERDTESQSWRERSARWLRPSFWRWRHEWRTSEYRQYSRHEGLVIAPARKVIADLEQHHQFPRERMRLIPNAVDVSRFSPGVCAAHRQAIRHSLGLRDETVFLFAAHNQRLKGIRPLLHAMRAVQTHRPATRLLVIGRALDRDTRRMIVRLGLAPAVLAAGFVPDQLPYFAAADAFVLPTYYDACSLSVLEAAACGMPVITTRHNGASELFTDGHDGLVLSDAEDIDALARSMIDLTERDVRSRMATSARALAIRHNMDDSVAQIERVYGEVVR